MRVSRKVTSDVRVSYGVPTVVLLALISVMLFFALLGLIVLVAAFVLAVGVVWWLAKSVSVRGTLLWAVMFFGTSYLVLTLMSSSWLSWTCVAVLWLWTAVGLGRSEMLRRQAWRARQLERCRAVVWPSYEQAWRPYSGSLLDD